MYVDPRVFITSPISGIAFFPQVTLLQGFCFMRIIQHKIHIDLGTLLWGSLIRSGDHDLTNGILRKSQVGEMIVLDFSLLVWWLSSQPTWKKCSLKWESSPRIGVNINNMWNHHLDNAFLFCWITIFGSLGSQAFCGRVVIKTQPLIPQIFLCWTCVLSSCWHNHRTV